MLTALATKGFFQFLEVAKFYPACSSCKNCFFRLVLCLLVPCHLGPNSNVTSAESPSLTTQLKISTNIVYCLIFLEHSYYLKQCFCLLLYYYQPLSQEQKLREDRCGHYRFKGCVPNPQIIAINNFRINVEMDAMVFRVLVHLQC